MFTFPRKHQIFLGTSGTSDISGHNHFKALSSKVFSNVVLLLLSVCGLFLIIFTKTIFLAMLCNWNKLVTMPIKGK